MSYSGNLTVTVLLLYSFTNSLRYLLKVMYDTDGRKEFKLIYLYLLTKYMVYAAYSQIGLCRHIDFDATRPNDIGSSNGLIFLFTDICSFCRDNVHVINMYNALWKAHLWLSVTERQSIWQHINMDKVFFHITFLFVHFPTTYVVVNLVTIWTIHYS